MKKVELPPAVISGDIPSLGGARILGQALNDLGLDHDVI
jgi:hypothetical protein